MDIPKFSEIFHQLKFNLWLIGIPLNDTKIRIRYFMHLSCLTLMLVGEFAFFVSRISSENILQLTELAPCLGIGILSILKVVSIAYKRNQVTELTKNLSSLYNSLINDTEKSSVVANQIILAKTFSKTYFVLNMVLITVFNFSTLGFIAYIYLSEKRLTFNLPYAILVPFSTENWRNWILVYTHSIISGFICVLYFTTVDVLYCVLTSQVCCNFAILSAEIKNLTPLNCKNLSNIVKRHQYVLKLSEDLENIFTATNFFNVSVGSIEICALCLNLSLGDWKKIPQIILFLLSVLLQILIMSIFGQNLIRESEKISNSAYLCQWYEMDKTAKNTILLIILRANKAQKLTAYKFSVIGHLSFTKILSTSWSYFTLLSTFYQSTDIEKFQ